MKYDRFYHFRVSKTGHLMVAPRRPHVDMSPAESNALEAEREKFRRARIHGGVSVYVKLNADGTLSWTATHCLKSDRFSRDEAIEKLYKNIKEGVVLTTENNIEFDDSFAFAEKIARKVHHGIPLVKALSAE